ncbi:hypothetical protein Tco_0469311 [Tanacetum coccineum]
MIQFKEMMQDNNLKNSKSKDKGSRSRSQSMNEQSHYKQDKTKTRQSINVKSHIFNFRGDNDKTKQTPTRMSSVVRRSLKKETLTWGRLIHKDGDGDASFQLKSDSLPHAHAQTTKTYYKHQDLRIMKAQELKTKTSAQTLIYKIFLQRYQVYQGRLLASFQDDAKYEHVGQDTRSQGGKDDQDKQGKDLKISDIKTKSKDNDKGSRSKITKHEGTSLQRIQRPRPQDLNDKSNLIDLMKECHNELTSGEIVSLKILSRTMEVRS